MRHLDVLRTLLTKRVGRYELVCMRIGNAEAREFITAKISHQLSMVTRMYDIAPMKRFVTFIRVLIKMYLVCIR